MAIKIITTEGGTVSSALDSALYNGLSFHSDALEFGNFIISGGAHSYDNLKLTINKMKAVGCGRMFEITDSETVSFSAPLSGTQLYTVVFRMQPYAERDKIQTVAVPFDDVIHQDDISSGSGIYDVQYATVAVNADGSATVLQLLCKSPVYKTQITEALNYKMGDSIPIPTVEAVINYVKNKLCENYEDADVHKFLTVGNDKQLELVKLYGTETSGLLKLGEDGLELSLSGILTITRLMNELLRNTADCQEMIMNSANDGNIHSCIITLSNEYNKELYQLFKCQADRGFMTVFSYKEDDVLYNMQVVYPLAVAHEHDIAPVASRSKVGDAEWSAWRISEIEKTVDISDSFGSWNPALGDSVEKFINVVKSGNIINGSMIIAGHLPASFLNINNNDSLFTITEEYRPAISILTPNAVALTSLNDGHDVAAAGSLCVADSDGNIAIGIETENAWNAVYITFSYVIDKKHDNVAAGYGIAHEDSSTELNCFNVRAYGAVGDGKTDDSGAIQDALHACHSAGGGTVVFPYGTYLINECVYYDSNMVLLFEKGATLKRGSASLRYLMANDISNTVTGYNGTHDVRIIGATFDGNSAFSTTSHNDNKCTLLNTGHARNITVEDCVFRNGNVWHFYEVCASENVKIINCIFDGSNYGGTSDQQDSYSELLQFDNDYNSSSNASYGATKNGTSGDETACENIHVSGCKFICNGYTNAIGNHNAKSKNHKRIRISDCFFTGGGVTGGYIDFDTSTIEVDIYNNTFDGQAVRIQASGSKVTVHDNRIDNASEPYIGSLTAYCNLINGMLDGSSADDAVEVIDVNSFANFRSGDSTNGYATVNSSNSTIKKYRGRIMGELKFTNVTTNSGNGVLPMEVNASYRPKVTAGIMAEEKKIVGTGYISSTNGNTRITFYSSLSSQAISVRFDYAI